MSRNFYCFQCKLLNLKMAYAKAWSGVQPWSGMVFWSVFFAVISKVLSVTLPRELGIPDVNMLGVKNTYSYVEQVEILRIFHP